MIDLQGLVEGKGLTHREILDIMEFRMQVNKELKMTSDDLKMTSDDLEITFK